MEGKSTQKADPGLERRFSGLLERMGLEAHFAGVYPGLVEQYSGAGRYYHNLSHIGQCLGVLDEVRGLLQDPDAAELAVWFHDVVYDPGSDDNELRSALQFDRLLGVHLPTERANRIHAMIMATVHPSETREPDEQLVADIDLSGLGLPSSKFSRDTESLRMECRHLTDSQFQLGTLSFFKKLLSRSSIYLTRHFREKYEDQAYRNIQNLVSRIEAEKYETGMPG